MARFAPVVRFGPLPPPKLRPVGAGRALLARAGALAPARARCGSPAPPSARPAPQPRSQSPLLAHTHHHHPPRPAPSFLPTRSCPAQETSPSRTVVPTAPPRSGGRVRAALRVARLFLHRLLPGPRSSATRVLAVSLRDGGGGSSNCRGGRSPEPTKGLGWARPASRAHTSHTEGHLQSRPK